MQQSIIQSFVHEKEKADYIAKFISDHIDASSSRLFEFIAETYTAHKSIILKFKSDWLQETSSKFLRSYYTKKNNLGKLMQQDKAEYEQHLAENSAKTTDTEDSVVVDLESGQSALFTAEETPIEDL